ncbi:MAG: hypothetical protein ABIS44_05310 [Mycobacteriales bacterium]
MTEELREVLEARTRDHEPDWFLAESIIERVPRQRRRRRMAAGASGVLAALAAIGVLSLRPDRDSADLAGGPLNQSPGCAALEVRSLGAGFPDAAPTSFLVLLANTSSADTCELRGPLQLRLFAPDELDVDRLRNPRAEEPVDIRPGGVLAVFLEWDNWCGRPVSAARMRIGVPGGSDLETREFQPSPACRDVNFRSTLRVRDRDLTDDGATGSASPSATPTQAGQEDPVLPGGDAVTRLGTPIRKDGVGPQLVRLGPPPAGATHIGIEFSCLTAGSFEFADGSSMTCTADDVPVEGQPAALKHRLPLAPGQNSTTISTDGNARWRLLAAYARVEKTAWGVNERGETYGVANADGTPDLVAVVATDGNSGYAYAGSLEEASRPTSPAEAATWAPAPRAPVPVYESDGRTVVGEFTFGTR